MPEHNPQIDLNEEQRTEIVAYLDGELDVEAAERVQRLLADNVAARRAAEEMTIAWEALDSLEGIKASENFTEKTFTNIRALAETERNGRPKPFDLKRLAMLGGWMVGIVGSSVAGFCTTNWSVPEQSQELVRDLDLIKTLPKYERVGDVNILDELKKQELFDDQ